eukprot:CAMPEP_0115765916 /NCGR_PEP_ID=MMETSP0272-20121206/102846_1 /TAXON_ID=71861 /ORGANISM="Scrippsiella trochoidea, Strain CCMP3099" /LENGTH=343 /DNA_ID=CAMNT_0003211797 /DNA_START=383 /DNA_END=1414 /DNA_ORIENTATION=+
MRFRSRRTTVPAIRLQQKLRGASNLQPSSARRSSPRVDPLLSERTCSSMISLGSWTARSSKQEFSGTISSPPIPKCFRCAMCNEIMAEPTIAADGLSYHRKCIESWFESGHETSPVTNAPLQSFTLHPNNVLKDAAQQYFALRSTVEQDQQHREEVVAATERRVSCLLEHRDSQIRILKASLKGRLKQLGLVDSREPTVDGGSDAATLSLTETASECGRVISLDEGIVTSTTVSTAGSESSECSSGSNPQESTANMVFFSGAAPRVPSCSGCGDGGNSSSCSSSSSSSSCSSSSSRSNDSDAQQIATSPAEGRPPRKNKLLHSLSHRLSAPRRLAAAVSSMRR